MKTSIHTILNDLYDGYAECALWSSNDESDERGGEPLDANFSVSDISLDSERKMRLACARFYKANKKDLHEYVTQRRGSRENRSQWELVGHDFWLNANGHGSGFWDSFEVDERLRKRLSEASRKYLSDLYRGDDGELHISR